MERILVICRSNAGRSQIAQAFLKTYHRPSAVRSAGTNVREEERQGYLLRQDIVDGGVPYGFDISGNRRGQLKEEDLDWADHVVVTMPREELGALGSRRLADNLSPGDVDAARLVDWTVENEGKVTFFPVGDIRAGEAETRSPEQVAGTYAEIDRLVKGWVAGRAATPTTEAK